MEPISTPPPVVPTAPPRGVFGTNIPSSVTSVLAFLLFFLPFAELRCTTGKSTGGDLFSQSSGTVFSNSGMGLALGLEWKTSLGPFGNGTNTNGNQKDKPNYYALIAWILALATAGMCISKWKWGSQLSMASAALSLAAMVGLFIDLKKKVKDIPTTDVGSGGMGANAFSDVKMEMVFTAWYYAAALLLVATIWLIWKYNNEKR